MSPSTHKVLGSLLAAALFLPQFAVAQDFSDEPVAVLVTEAKLAGYGKGKVLGYFPQALISRDPLRRTKGHFFFDSDEKRLKETQIPLQIKFERATGTTTDGKYTETTPEKFEYALATDAFLAKLNTLMTEVKPEGKEALVAAGFVPAEPFNGLKNISKEKLIFRYLLKKDSETSYLVEIGDRTALETVHKSLTAVTETAQNEIYTRHFKPRYLEVHLFKLRSGQKPSNARVIKGVALSRHRTAEMPSGRVIVNHGADTAPWTMATTKLEYSGESTDVEFPAAAFLENVISPLLTEKGKEALKLDCVIGEIEDETACKKSKEGALSIKGVLDGKNKLSFVVERAGAKGDDYQDDLYRVELHSAN